MTRGVRIAVALCGVVVVTSLAASAGGALFWQRYASALLRGHPAAPMQDYQPRALLRGGDGGGLPRSEPGAEGIDGAALQAAEATARAADADALLVLRHGHVVYERYYRGTSSALVDSGELAQLLRSAATAAAVQDGLLQLPEALALHAQAVQTAQRAEAWRNPWSLAAQRRFGAVASPEYLTAITHQRYAEYVAQRIWSPLDAADAQLWQDAHSDAVHTDCCVLARPSDWLRLARVLLADGRLDGEPLLSGEWVRRMFTTSALGLRNAGAAQGPESFVTAGVAFVPGVGATRLWLVPRLQLAVLYVANQVAARADDTTLVNIILRGTRHEVAQDEARRNDQPDIRSLVPAH